MVTRNPVANLAPVHSVAGLPAPDVRGDFDVSTFHPVADPPQPVSAVQWDALIRQQMMPTTDISAQGRARKASVNTADFTELWRAFWMVMHRQDAAGGNTNTPPFPDLARDPLAKQLTSGKLNAPASRRMFRSVIRDPKLTSAFNTDPTWTPANQPS